MTQHIRQDFHERGSGSKTAKLPSVNGDEGEFQNIVIIPASSVTDLQRSFILTVHVCHSRQEQ